MSEENERLSSAAESLKQGMGSSGVTDVTAGPNLIVDRIDFDPSSVAPGGEAEMSCRVKNTGDATAGSSYVGYYIVYTKANGSPGDHKFGNDLVSSLREDRTSPEDREVTIPSDAKPGSMAMVFCMADEKREIQETDENDNFSTNVTISISAGSTGKPNLAIRNQRASVSSAKPGDTVRLEATIVNNGEAESESTVLRYKIVRGSREFKLGSDDTVGSLDRNEDRDESTTVALPDDLDPGEWQFTFIVDPDDRLDEETRYDNIATVPVTIEEPPVPEPEITGISPSEIVLQAGQQGFSVLGNNFAPNATVELWDLTLGTGPHPGAGKTTYRSSGELYRVANFDGSAGRWRAQVKNPDGQLSNTFDFDVIAAVVLRPPAPQNLRPGSANEPGPALSAGTETLSWDAATGATSYRLYVSRSTTSDFISFDRLHNGTVVNVTSFPLTIEAGYYYRWTVAGYNSAGEGDAIPNRHFYVPSDVTVPAEPTGLTPGTLAAPGTQISAGTVTLSWNAVTGATGYKVSVTRSLDQAFSSPDHFVSDQPTNTNSYQVTAQAGYYYRWNVVAVNSAGESTIPDRRYFYVPSVVTKPPAPQNLRPGVANAPGTQLNAGTETLSWDAAAGATSYRLYVTRSTSSGFSSFDRIHNGTTVNSTSFPLPIEAGYYYRWTVAGYNAAGEGDAVSNRHFYVPASVVTRPPMPTGLTPGTASPPGTLRSVGTVTLSWNAIAGATYKVSVTRALDQNFSSPDRFIYDEPTNTNSFDVTVQAGYFYRWNVVAVNSAGESNIPPPIHFYVSSIVARPDRPVSTGPGTTTEPGPVLGSMTPSLAWGSVPGAAEYVIAIKDLATGEFPVDDVVISAPATFYPVPSGRLEADRSYAWDLLARNASGESPRSANRYFRTPGSSTTTPGKPVISEGGSSTSPGPELSTLTPILRWNVVANATDYLVSLRDAASEEIVIDDARTTTNTYEVPFNTLRPGRVYKWDLVARINTARGPRSDTYYFRTATSQTALGYPVPMSPGDTSPNGPFLLETTQTFTWDKADGATSYTVYLTESGTITSYRAEHTSLEISGLKRGTYYSWTVSARDASGQERQSTILRYFQVAADPTAPFPDYEVSSLSLSASSGKPGEKITATFTVRNLGASTSISTTARLRFSPNLERPSATDPPIPYVETSIGGLPSGVTSGPHTLTFEVPHSANGGQTYYVWITADVNRALKQISESNDRRSHPLSVTGTTSSTQIPVAHSFRYPFCSSEIDPTTEEWIAPNPDDGWGYDHGSHVDGTYGPYRHLGEDWNHPRDGDPVLSPNVCAPAVGAVQFADSTVNLGYVVVIRHRLNDNQLVESVFAHLRKHSIPSRIRVGAIVDENTVIGRVGSSGGAWSSHLHWEIRASTAYYWGAERSDHRGVLQGRGGTSDVAEWKDYFRPSEFVRDRFGTNTQPIMRPDVTIESFTIEPHSAGSSDDDGGINRSFAESRSSSITSDILVSFRLQNATSTPVQTPFKVALDLLDENGIAVRSLQTIEFFAGKALWTFAKTTPNNPFRLLVDAPGRYRVRLRIDPDNILGEDAAGRDNNTQEVSLNITETPSPESSCDLRTSRCLPEIAAAIREIAAKYHIPTPLLAALIWSESEWKHYDKNGDLLMNIGRDGEPGDGGFGIGQITPICDPMPCRADEKYTLEIAHYVPSPDSDFGYYFDMEYLKLGSRNEPTPERTRLEQDWKYSLETAAAHLLSKYSRWASLRTADPAPPKRYPGLPETKFDDELDVDPSILENWYYALGWYKGSDVQGYINLQDLIDVIISPDPTIGAYTTAVPSVGFPSKLSYFPRTIKERPWSGVDFKDLDEEGLIRSGVFTVLALAKVGLQIHRWNWDRNSLEPITSIVRAQVSSERAIQSMRLEPGTNLISLSVASERATSVAAALSPFGFALEGTDATGLDPNGCYVTSVSELACGPLADLPALANTGYVIRLNSSAPQERELVGVPVQDTVLLAQGLNLIGRPGNGLFQPNQDVYPFIFSLDGDLVTASPIDRVEMASGQAYYVYARAATSLVPRPQASAQSKVQERDESDFEQQAHRVAVGSNATEGPWITDASLTVPGTVAVTFMATQDGASASTMAQVGWQPDATDDFDETLDDLQALPLPRRPGLFVDELYGLSRSLRAPGAATYEWPIVLQEGAFLEGSPVILSWTLLGLPADTPVLLVDSEGRIVADLLTQSSLVLQGTGAGSVWRYRVQLTPSTGVATEDEVPSTFSIDAPYPNPFQDRTELGVTLDEPGQVRVVVYDILGRQVAVLNDDSRPAGKHLVRWDAAAHVAAGVYLLQVNVQGSTRSHSEVRKVIRLH